MNYLIKISLGCCLIVGLLVSCKKEESHDLVVAAVRLVNASKYDFESALIYNNPWGPRNFGRVAAFDTIPYQSFETIRPNDTLIVKVNGVDLIYSDDAFAGNFALRPDFYTLIVRIESDNRGRKSMTARFKKD